MDIEVNYKNKKRYKTAKYPLHPTIFWTGLIWLLSRIALTGRKYKVQRIGMEDLKPPYMLLSNHMHFIDFELTAMGTWPHPVSNVAASTAMWANGSCWNGSAPSAPGNLPWICIW